MGRDDVLDSCMPGSRVRTKELVVDVVVVHVVQVRVVMAVAVVVGVVAVRMQWCMVVVVGILQDRGSAVCVCVYVLCWWCFCCLWLLVVMDEMEVETVNGGVLVVLPDPSTTSCVCVRALLLLLLTVVSQASRHLTCCSWRLAAPEYAHLEVVNIARKALVKQTNAMLNQWRRHLHICENYNPHRNGSECTGSR